MCHPCGFTGFGKDPLTHGSAALHPGPGCFIPAGWASIDSMNSNVSPLRGFRFRLYPWTQGSAALHPGLRCFIPAGWTSTVSMVSDVSPLRGCLLRVYPMTQGSAALHPGLRCFIPAGWTSTDLAVPKDFDVSSWIDNNEDARPGGAVQFSPGCSAAEPWGHTAMKQKKSPTGATL